MNGQQQAQQHLAAIDLGSNSFHMVVARIEDGHIHILDNLKEMVRLATLLHRSRKEETAIIANVTADEMSLTLQFAKDELVKHPLQLASLEQEADYLRNVEFELRFFS